MAAFTAEELRAKFAAIYPEFGDILATDIGAAQFDAVCVKVQCQYTEFTDLADCTLLYPFLALVAHYFVDGGFAASIGITSAASGLVANSSVGDVSVGYQSAPYDDEYAYFLAKTKYGQEYLAWLKRRSGLIYVNH